MTSHVIAALQRVKDLRKLGSPFRIGRNLFLPFEASLLPTPDSAAPCQFGLLRIAGSAKAGFTLDRFPLPLPFTSWHSNFTSGEQFVPIAHLLPDVYFEVLGPRTLYRKNNLVRVFQFDVQTSEWRGIVAGRAKSLVAVALPKSDAFEGDALALGRGELMIWREGGELQWEIFDLRDLDAYGSDSYVGPSYEYPPEYERASQRFNGFLSGQREKVEKFVVDEGRGILTEVGEGFATEMRELVGSEPYAVEAAWPLPQSDRHFLLRIRLENANAPNRDGVMALAVVGKKRRKK